MLDSRGSKIKVGSPTTNSLINGGNPGSLNRWDRYHIIPQLAVYTTYIPLIVLAYWVIIYHRSHLLRDPETAIDLIWCQ